MESKKNYSQIKYSNRLILFITLSAVFITLAAGTGCSRQEQNRAIEVPASEVLIPVDALTADKGKLIEYVEASGLLKGYKEAFVVSQTSGIIEEVFFDLGMSVSMGDILLKVDDTVPRLAMEQALVQLENARLELNAVTRLQESGSVSTLQFNQARIKVRGAEAGYEAALKAFQDCTIRAPISGFIASREEAASAGSLITPGTAIASITDTTRLRMIISLGEGDVVLIQTGMAAEITVPACKVSAEGVVAAVAAGSDPVTGAFRAAVEWDNVCTDTVRSGMTAIAVIRAGGEDVLIVPSSALINRGADTFLFIAENEKAVLRKVETGRTIGGRTEILSSLSEGESVIFTAVNRLNDRSGVLVRITGSSSSFR